MNRSGEMSAMFMPPGAIMPGCLMLARTHSVYLIDEAAGVNS